MMLAPVLWAVVLTALGAAEPPAVVHSWRLAEPGQTLDGLALSPDGRYLAVRATSTAPAPDAIAVIDLQTAQPVARFSAASGWLSAPVWLPPHQLLYATADGLLVQSLETTRTPRRLELPVVAGPLAAASDGRLVACSAPERCLLLLDPRTGTQSGRLPLSGELRQVLFTEDGEQFLTLTVEASGATVLAVWDAAAGTLVARRPVPGRACLCLSPGRAAVVLGGAAGLFEYRLPDLALQRRWDCGEVRACLAAPREAGLALLRPDGRLSWLDAEGQVERDWTVGAVTEFLFSSPQQLAATVANRLGIYGITR